MVMTGGLLILSKWFRILSSLKVLTCLWLVQFSPETSLNLSTKIMEPKRKATTRGRRASENPLFLIPTIPISHSVPRKQNIPPNNKTKPPILKWLNIISHSQFKEKKSRNKIRLLFFFFTLDITTTKHQYKQQKETRKRTFSKK